MKKYIEITLLPDIDTCIHTLWAKVFRWVHVSIVEVKNHHKGHNIAVGFPAYNEETNSLGAKLRVFSDDQETLKMFAVALRLSRLPDHAHTTIVKDVPGDVSTFACFKNLSPKANKHKRARRLAKRSNITFDEALAKYDDYQDKEIKLPYINTVSSKKLRFPMFINMTTTGNCEKGNFNSYGLSSSGVVPVF
jgi:CRISPR-associated endonuclease Csy4